MGINCGLFLERASEVSPPSVEIESESTGAGADSILPLLFVRCQVIRSAFTLRKFSSAQLEKNEWDVDVLPMPIPIPMVRPSMSMSMQMQSWLMVP